MAVDRLWLSIALTAAVSVSATPAQDRASIYETYRAVLATAFHHGTRPEMGETETVVLFRGADPAPEMQVAFRAQDDQRIFVKTWIASRSFWGAMGDDWKTSSIAALASRISVSTQERSFAANSPFARLVGRLPKTAFIINFADDPLVLDGRIYRLRQTAPNGLVELEVGGPARSRGGEPILRWLDDLRLEVERMIATKERE